MTKHVRHRCSKLRLLVTDRCTRGCEMCCNRQFDLASLPVCNAYGGYDEILLTGGEPLTEPVLLRNIILDIRREAPAAKIFLYTSVFGHRLLYFYDYLDGITASVRTNDDIDALREFTGVIRSRPAAGPSKSLRLKVFADREKMTCWPEAYAPWKVTQAKWLPRCPVPDGEDFMLARENFPMLERFRHESTLQLTGEVER